MSDQKQGQRDVLLVGSVPLESNVAVFETACGVLSRHLRRVPDGETGERINWIGWQFSLLSSMPEFEIVPVPPDQYSGIPQVKLRQGVSANEVVFPELGYSAAARASYDEFARLKHQGKIPQDCRFQVSLPTPLAPIYAFVVAEDQSALEPIYEAKLLEELEEILASIPAKELAIQWDVAAEFALLEGVWPTRLRDVTGEILERLVRIGNQVPADVELGYHLCYGDAGHRHFKEPEDTRKLVKIANGIAAGLQRPLNWIHLPVPRDRSDEAYFAPLKNLRLPPETKLYLGLVHHTDGVEGARRRIEAARQVVTDFGVATECGLGRRPPETIAELLRIHAEVAE